MDAAEVCSVVDAAEVYSVVDAAEVCSVVNAAEVCRGVDTADVCSGVKAARVCSVVDAAEVCSVADAAEVCSGRDAANVCSGGGEAGHRLLRQEAGQCVVGVVVFSQVNIINHHWGVSFSAYPPRRVLCVNGERSEIEIEIVIENEIERDMDWIGLEVVCWFTQAGVCVYTGRSCPLRMEAFTQEVFVGSVYKEV